MTLLAASLLVFAVSQSDAQVVEPPAELSDRLADPVRLEVDGKPMDSGGFAGHSGPALFDLDGDGVRELLVGNFRGTVQVFERDERSASPAWKARGFLMVGGEKLTVPNW